MATSVNGALWNAKTRPKMWSATSASPKVVNKLHKRSLVWGVLGEYAKRLFRAVKDGIGDEMDKHIANMAQGAMAGVQECWP